MAKYKVIAEFVDLQEKTRRKVGDIIDVSAERARDLQAIGVIGREPEKPSPNKPDNDDKKPEGDGKKPVGNKKADSDKE